ncbi:hypothetical protein C8Q79DRAFT_1002796 [Trametes meyenii]|nr:hypothetical protein C8Q79DRAFT_1002796 [Trametes meyenii]
MPFKTSGQARLSLSICSLETPQAIPLKFVSFVSKEPEDVVIRARIFLAADLVAGVGYSLQLVLWFLCVSYLWRQRNRGWRITFLLVYLIVLIAVETVFVVTTCLNVQFEYVDNRDYPGGPWQYHLYAQDSPINTTFDASLFVLTFLGDLLVLYRCWVFWSVFGIKMAIVATAFPSLALAASFVLGTAWVLQSTSHDLSFRLPASQSAVWTAYYVLSLAVNITLTGLITLRLLAYRRAHLKLLPSDHAKQYLSLAAIVVESAAIHTAFAIVLVISYGMQAPEAALFTVAASAAQVASYLIIYRVADGKAWSRNTLHLETMSSLVFTAAGREDAIPADPRRSDLNTSSL